MRLSVKVVGGCECECDASPDSSVEELKRDVEAKLKLGKETEPKLLFRGKALQGIVISKENSRKFKQFHQFLFFRPILPNIICPTA